MKAIIKNVATNVTSKKEGNEGRIFNLITLTDGSVIVRNNKQFQADLKGSFLKDRDVKDLIGGVVEGDTTFHKAGEKYKADENSSAVLNGEAQIGDELVYAQDGYRTNGFLNLTVNSKADMLNRTAQASAELMSELFGLTITPESATTVATPAVEFVPEA